MLTAKRLTNCITTLSENKTLLAVLSAAAESIPQAWYLIGGSLYQTVWNVQHGRDPDADVGDYDVVYFDQRGTEAQDQRYERTISGFVPGVKVQVKNQALITNAWYERQYHCPKDTLDYLSLEDAISKAYVSSPVIGVTWKERELQVLELAGIEDLLSLRVYPNSKFRDARVLPFYRNKYCKWHRIWPLVTFYNWDEEVVKTENDI